MEVPRERGRGIGGISRRAAAWLAWAVCAVGLLLLALTLFLILLGWSTPLPRESYPWANQAIDIVAYIGAPIIGGLVASRRPANPYGWLWLGFGLSLSLLSFAEAYAPYALAVEPGSLPAPRTISTLGQTVGFVGALTLLSLILLSFPNGRPPSQRWKFVAWTVIATGAVLLLIGPFTAAPDGSFENPLGIGGPVGRTILTISDGLVYVLIGPIIPSALSLVFRYRRAAEAERQQIKWFAYAAALLCGYIVLSFFLPTLLNTLVAGVAFLGLYAAIGVAILRYRLYNIDLLINRTLVYGSLTAMLALVYVGGVAGLQAAFRSLTGQESTLAVVASTLAIAALFGPLRRRVQRLVDRRFYRRKYDAVKTLEAFGFRLRKETDLDALSGDLVRVASRTVQPEHVSLWLRPDAEPEARSAALRQSFGHVE